MDYFRISEHNPYDLTKITPQRDELTGSWIEGHEGESPYTYPNLIIELPGGMAVGSCLTIAVLYWMMKYSIRVPIIVGRSAPAMPLSLLQQGYSLEQVFEVITHFDINWVKNDWREIMRERTYLGRKKLYEHFRRFGGEDRSRLLNRRRKPLERLESGFNIGFIVTDLHTGEPQILTSGGNIKAVMATTGLYPILPAVEIGGRPYADGMFYPALPHDAYTQWFKDDYQIFRVTRRRGKGGGLSANLRRVNSLAFRWSENVTEEGYLDNDNVLHYEVQTQPGFGPLEYNKPKAAREYIERIVYELDSMNMRDELDRFCNREG